MKFEVLIRMIEELPRCSFGLEDLSLILSDLHDGFDPYSSHFARTKTASRMEPELRHMSAQSRAKRWLQTLPAPV